MAVTCASCGSTNADEARFCNACGAALGSDSASVRKTVTVVFCDLVGSTALGDGADPEVLRGQMTGYHGHLRTVFERHGGRVEKFIGDAAMCVFGLPSAHEDDALRAVRAADEARTAVAELGFEVRIGVNTGEVVAGGGETLVTGDAVNVAARLEQAAGSGEILIGQMTERLVRDVVRSVAVKPLVVKGKAAPQLAYRVEQVGTDAAAFARRPDVPFVGREQELATLVTAFHRAADAREPQLATVTGPPGIGKTRLLQELLTTAPASVLTGRCLSYGQGITYWPLQEIARQVGDIRAALGSIDDAELAAARIAAAQGTGSASSDEIAWGFRKLFEVLAQREPLIVVVEDIHWAEPTLLDLLEYLAEFSVDARLLVLCTARPELLEIRPGWAAPRSNGTLLTLEALPAAQTETLVDELGEVSPADRQRIIEAAEGNPLFLEQLVAMRTSDSQRNSTFEIPPTVQALLAARIDRLDKDERAVIERASIEGRLFHRGSVRQLLPDAARPEVGRRLSTLVRRQFIRPDQAALTGDDAYRFDHILIRDAAYESLPKSVRAELHVQFADWLADRLGGDALPEIIGFHLEQAFNYQLELSAPDSALGERAAHELIAAARGAAARQDVHAQVTFLERALEMLPRDSAGRTRVLVDLGYALATAGEDERAMDRLQQAEAVARELGDGRVEWLARLRIVEADTERHPEGATDRLMAEAQAAIAAQPDDDEVLARAWRVVGWAHNWAGHNAQMQDAMQTAWEHALAVGDANMEMDIAYPSGAPVIFGPIPVEEGLRWVSNVVEQAHNRAAAEFWSRHMMAHLRARLGDFSGAGDAMSSWRAQLRELGQENRYLATAGCAWDVCWLAADWSGGERALREAYEILERSGDRAFRPLVAAQLADALLRLDRLDEAAQFSEISQELVALDDVFNNAASKRVGARVLAERGEVDRAVQLAKEAVDLMAETDFLDERAATLLDYATVLRAGSREADATTAVRQAVALYEAKGNLVGRARAEAMLARS